MFVRYTIYPVQKKPSEGVDHKYVKIKLFDKFPGNKYLYQILLFNKVTFLQLAVFFKKNSDTGLSMIILRNF